MRTVKTQAASLPVALVIASLLLGPACGHVSTPTAPAPYTQTVTGTVSAFAVVLHPLTIPRSGDMTLTLTWQDAAVNLNLYLTSSSCTNLYPMTLCQILESSATPAETTERITHRVTSGETYSIFVDNLSLVQGQAYTLSLSIQ